MPLADLLPRVLLVLGLGFLVATLRVAGDLVRWWRRRADALVVWRGPRPPFYGLTLGLAVLLGLLVVSGLVLLPRPVTSLFGEAMMCVYYGYAVPLSTHIRRGLYADGIWTDTGFVPYAQIGGVSWTSRETNPTLVVLVRDRPLARRLTVPAPQLGEVRRVLREQIAEHGLVQAGGLGLQLEGHDLRDDV